MKLLHNLIATLIFSCIVSVSVGQKNPYKATSGRSQAGTPYITYQNDPLGARIYTLPNGLTVYLSSYKDAPRIQTYVAVRAGSKNDPAHATGLAHYLEHILFKGTSKIGTQNWAKEKPLLDQIEQLYEVYRRTTDTQERERLYATIDSLSIIASSYSIANEYDKLLSTIGAEGTNAYTFLEQTVYVNDIPSNQIEKWAEIEAERFGEVVPRLFHTELEAVYEEKNKGMDQDRRKVWETLMGTLFQKNTYGTQTTIGTVEHLKNPSITEIKKYFDAYYVANNMAVCMSGDLDYDKTIAIIEKHFSKLRRGTVPAYKPAQETPISTPLVQNVLGPDAENVTIAFRAGGINTSAPAYLKMISMLLTNGQAGLIDLNLNQQQKLIGGYAQSMPFNDYSIFALGGRPRQGQSLEEVTGLLLEQLEQIKKGNFEDWLIRAVVNDYTTTQLKNYESNRLRADAFVSAFIAAQPWDKYLSELNELQRMKKKDIVAFARKNFTGHNYVAVYKRKGIDSSIQKVPKPKISPVELNRDKQSAFYSKITAQPSESIAPVFIDFEKDMSISRSEQNPDILYKQNTENGLFNLSFVWETRGYLDPKYSFAARYLGYLGTPSLSAENLKKEFYKLGCSYSVNAAGDRVVVTLSGLHENFEQALKLLEALLENPKEDNTALANLVEDLLKQRADNKLNKDIILRNAMSNYVKYGDDNPLKYMLSESELKKITAAELTALIKSLKDIRHKVLYYGPSAQESLRHTLDTYHRSPKAFGHTLSQGKTFEPLPLNKTQVYFVDYDMVQAEVLFMSRSVDFDAALIPQVAMFNEYFGGSMGSLVFQEMRESRALAYSVRSKYDHATRQKEPNYITSYIGTQADKIIEAIDGLSDLLDNMPQSDVLFETSRQSLIESLSTTRITKANILLGYETAQRLGLTHDTRKDVYEQVQQYTFKDIRQFQQAYVKNKPKAILVIGSKSRINLKELERYGSVTELDIDELFGY
jgi:zinc protease